MSLIGYYLHNLKRLRISADQVKLNIIERGREPESIRPISKLVFGRFYDNFPSLEWLDIEWLRLYYFHGIHRPAVAPKKWLSRLTIRHKWQDLHWLHNGYSGRSNCQYFHMFSTSAPYECKEVAVNLYYIICISVCDLLDFERLLN